MEKRKIITPRLRFQVFKRDGFKCQYCGRTHEQAILEVDHVIPVSQGGGSEPNNLITSCQECNRGKSNAGSDTSLEDLQLKIPIRFEESDAITSFGNRLKQLRELSNVSQGELAEVIDVSDRAIRRYESGITEPNVSQLIRLSDFFGVTLDFLVGRTNSPNQMNMTESQALGKPLRELLAENEEADRNKANHSATV